MPQLKKLIDFMKHMTPLPLHFEEDAWLCRLAHFSRYWI